MCTAGVNSRPAGVLPARPIEDMDPDLRPYYAPAKSLAWNVGNKGLLPGVVAMQSRNQRLLAEQERRDTLRTQHAEAEQAANDQLAKISEQQEQAQAARATEAGRQAQMQQKISRAREQQQELIDQERAATDAVTMASMTLGASASSAPAAQVNRGRRGRGRGRSAAGTQSLRIGAARQTPGAGLNIGV